ncbi:amino acid ABC transporter permease [Candidatus Aerophobetes bacterium]|nr:amino acid ABC transporter permease [Candidatus Aerophobetes bacterium]
MFVLIKQIMPQLFEGTLVTLQLTGTAISLGFAMGIFLALGRLYGKGPLKAFCKGYIEFFRGTPLLVQLFIVYYGLPRYGIRVSSTLAAFLGLGLNSAAYQAEYFRGAIQSIPEGQMMAARAIGMTKFQAIFNIILPQALRLSIPPWSNEYSSVLKDTSLAYAVGVIELVREGRYIIVRTFEPMLVYITIALIYFILTYTGNKILSFLEKKLEVPGYELKLKEVKDVG